MCITYFHWFRAIKISLLDFSSNNFHSLFWQSPEPKDQTLKMIKILSGEMAIELHLQFLIRNNNTDLMILKNTKVENSSIMEAFFLYLFLCWPWIPNTYFLLNNLLHFVVEIHFWKNNNGRDTWSYWRRKRINADWTPVFCVSLSLGSLVFFFLTLLF